MSDHSIRPVVDIAELADLAARKAQETHEEQANPFPTGTPEFVEFAKRYHIANLRLSAELLGDASA